MRRKPHIYMSRGEWSVHTDPHAFPARFETFDRAARFAAYYWLLDDLLVLAR